MPLIATDLDGTLLMTGSSTPHPDAVAAVHQALAAGIPVVFATGRAPQDVVDIANEVGHRWWAVCCDGTVLVDLNTLEVTTTHTLSESVMRDVVERLRDQFPEVKFLVDRVNLGPIAQGEYGILFEEGFKAPWAWALNGAREVGDIMDFIAEEAIVKIAAYVPVESSDDAIFHQMKATVEDLVTVVRINSSETYIDMCKLGVSKATGVNEIAELHGISRESVFAVGDMHNDLELLQWAGFSFAVANATSALHDIADVIVPSNDEGGVRHVIDAAMDYLRQP
jgi:Cof subfamily protein (haloacid dehalogenase superfamily)